MLYQKLIDLRNKFSETLFSEHFKKPHFHIVVLFIDEKESVKRQLHRGRETMAHNAEVEETGVGQLKELRPTDLDPQAALNRYRTFKEKTYGALKDLREIFFYHFINAHGPIEEVRKRIDEELRYQGSLELDEATYDRVSQIPVATSITKHARQDLVDRLDNYAVRAGDLFDRVIELIREEFVPIIERHAISGRAVVNTESPVMQDPDALAMLIDIFSERGYSATVDIRREEVPDSIDPKTFKIKTRVKRVYRVRVYFKGSDIRRGR